MNEFVKKIMTEDEFNSVNIMDRMAIEREAEFAKNMFSWTLAIRYCNLTEDTLRKFADRLDWKEISISQKHMTHKFIEDFKDKFDWSDLSQYQKFSKIQLLKYVDYIDWDRAPTFQKNVDEEVIDAVLASLKKDELNWHGVIVNVKMSCKFIEDHANYITKCGKWDVVSYYQNLSEDFMEKHSDRLNWNYMSQRQHLSKEFMIEHFDKLNKNWLKQFQKNWSDDIEEKAQAYRILHITDPQTIEQDFIVELKKLMEKYGYSMDKFLTLIRGM